MQYYTSGKYTATGWQIWQLAGKFWYLAGKWPFLATVNWMASGWYLAGFWLANISGNWLVFDWQVIVWQFVASRGISSNFCRDIYS